MECLRLGIRTLQDRGPIPSRGSNRTCSLHHRVHTVWDPSTFLSNEYREQFPGGKVAGREAIYSSLVPWLRMGGIIRPLPKHFFIACCLVKQEVAIHGMVLS
jgi:hypothetical protein